MIGYIGQGGLLLAFALSCLLAVPSKRATALVVHTITLILTVCFALLVTAYVISDYSLVNVIANSHHNKPLLYRITGTWGNHEGSMLLLVLIYSLYNSVFAYVTAKQPYQQLANRTLQFQGLWLSGILLFIALTSSPFEMARVEVIRGMGLNPLLQDIGLAIHPPVLYLGYMGLSLALSAAMAGLIERDVGRNWAIMLKPWVLVSTGFLTAGIGLGSWWAYRELGWGGIWFWDPVENASLLPWLSGLALLHSLLVVQKRETLTKWAVFLAMITFFLCLVGMFLVRSGILNSVHSFANSPERGMFMLLYIGMVMVVSAVIFAWRGASIQADKGFASLSKETIILVNNMLLLLVAATILLGTIYPILLQLANAPSVSVGGPYYVKTVLPVGLLMLFFAGLGPHITWYKQRVAYRWLVLIVAVIGAMLLIAGMVLLTEFIQWLAYGALLFAAWLLVSSVVTWNRYRKSAMFKKSPIGAWGMIIAHCGFAIMVIGITVSSVWYEEQNIVMRHNDHTVIGNYHVTLKGMYLLGEENYLARQGEFEIRDTDTMYWKGELKPEVRHYPIEDSNTTEAALLSSVLNDLYIALGETDDNGGYAVRLYVKPLISLVWVGVLMMFVGMICAVWQKRQDGGKA